VTTAARAGLAVVTGAGSPTGIGFAVARALGAAGHSLLVVSTTDRIRERVAELRAAGLEARGVVADLATEIGVEALADAAGGSPVDALVNNAGMAILGEMDALTEFDEVSLADWRRSLDRNLTTAFLVTRAFLPAMKRRGYGRIVNVSSTTGTVGAIAGDTAYAAAKSGMVGLTRALALETAPFGVTVKRRGPGLDLDRLTDGEGSGRGCAYAPGSLRHARRGGGTRRLARLARGLVRDRAARRRGRRQLDRRGPQCVSGGISRRTYDRLSSISRTWDSDTSIGPIERAS